MNMEANEENKHNPGDFVTGVRLQSLKQVNINSISFSSNNITRYCGNLWPKSQEKNVTLFIKMGSFLRNFWTFFHFMAASW